MNILLVNPGRRNYIIEYFLNLKKKFNLNIFIIDQDKNIPSFSLKKTKNYVCPAASKKNQFKKFLRKFVKDKKIKIIFPVSHWELPLLSEEKYFYQRKKIKVIVSDKKTINVCRNKINTKKILKKNKILFPTVINFKEIHNSLPIIKKRILGNGSKDQQIFFKKDEIPKKNNKSFFYQKYYRWKEFGLDILNDLNGNYYHSCARKKLSLRAGDTDKAQIVFSKKFFEIAKKISKAIKHIGILDVDFLFNGSKILILDLNPRIGGGYPFTHEAGFNYLEQILNWTYKKKKNINFDKKKHIEQIFSKGISIHKN
jgi:carbamoyl-phosphate synthase large subunit